MALVIGLDAILAFSVVSLAMKRLACRRCGSMLRGRGVGYCAWCNRHNAGNVVTESPGALWLMSQGLLPVPCVDWRIAMCCDYGVSVGLVDKHVPSMSSDSGVDVLRVRDSLVDMHVSPMSSDSDVEVLDVLDNFDMRVSPMSSDSDALTLEVLRQPVLVAPCGYYAELYRLRVARALAVLLCDESLAGIFSYCDDDCRLALANRYLYGHGVFVSLYRYWHEGLRDAEFEAYIEERAIVEQSCIDVGGLCHSCGLRLAVEVLAFVECWQCYDEHTD